MVRVRCVQMQRLASLHRPVSALTFRQPMTQFQVPTWRRRLCVFRRTRAVVVTVPPHCAFQ